VIVPGREWSRREVLRECLAGGVLLTTARLSEGDVLAAWSGKQTTHPTPHVEMGPFYKKRAPKNAHLRTAGEPGVPLSVTGHVLGSQGNPVPDAAIEIWQANDAGLYDLDGYRYRATLSPTRTGDYAFDSIIPGHYPARVCRHVHYLVTAPGYKPLITQLYFATDEVFEGDPDKNFTKDPLITSRDLVRPVVLDGAPGSAVARVTFELVLEKA
jgi:protocatechuate 3,4-dioxygenase beta subunit